MMKIKLLIILMLYWFSVSVFALEEISDTAKYNISKEIIEANKKFISSIPDVEDLNQKTMSSYIKENHKIRYTKEQQETIDYYKINPLRVGLYEWDPYFINDNGNYSGINYYLIELITRQLGIKISIITGSFSEIKQKLKDNELDVVPGLFQAEIDNNQYLASRPYFLDMPVVYGKDVRLGAISLEALQNIRLGKRTENGYFDSKDIDYLNKNNIHLNIKNYETDEALIAALKNGECDYIIGSMSAIYLSSGLYKVDLSEFELGKLHFIGVNNNRSEIEALERHKSLLVILNLFLNQETIKSVNAYLENFNHVRLKEGIFFTPEENELLSKNNTLFVRTLIDNSYPNIYFNPKTNRLNGKEVYIFDKICRLLGINYTNTIGRDSISKTLLDLSNSRLTAVLGISDSLNRGGVISPTKTISNSQFFIIGYENNINSYSDIFDVDIGLIYGQIKDKYLKNMFPSKLFKIYNSQEEAENALINKQVKYLIVNEDFYNYLVYFKKHISLIKCFKLNLTYNSVINFNSLKSGELYASIFSKALSFIMNDDFIHDAPELLNIDIERVIIQEINSNLKLTIGVFILLFLSALVVYQRYVKKEKIRATFFNDQYHDLLSMTHSSFWYIKNASDEIVVTDELINDLSLQRLRLIDKSNRPIIKINESFAEYFFDKDDFLRLKEASNKVKSGMVSGENIKVRFAKNRDKNNVALLLITIRASKIKSHLKVYGIVRDVTFEDS